MARAGTRSVLIPKKVDPNPHLRLRFGEFDLKGNGFFGRQAWEIKASGADHPIPWGDSLALGEDFEPYQWTIDAMASEDRRDG